jgi:hypothetical protein
MKKLLSAFCCVLCLHTFGKAPSDLGKSSMKSAGEKQLVKALTAIVNREDNKKRSEKRLNPTPSESPWI